MFLIRKIIGNIWTAKMLANGLSNRDKHDPSGK